MRTNLVLGSLWLLAAVGAVTPASQTYTFQRSFPGATRVDVTTHRGKIVVTAGDEPRVVVVAATVTVKRGLNTPPNSGQLAAGLADRPPVRQQGATVQLGPPDDPLVDRIVTIDYDVHVPASATVVATNDSGAVTIGAIEGSVTVRTQSGPIDVTLPPALPVTLDATSGSGAIDVDRDLVKGSADKGRVRGTIHGGGIVYQLTTKSGTIRIK